MKVKDRSPAQQDLFASPAEKPRPSKFISTYRVSLVRDQDLPFEQCRLMNSQQAQPIIKNLSESQGQSDREQFCVLLLNAKNKIIGLNIVATGTVSSAQVCPREVLKPAILANSSAIILSHNHPSGIAEPSQADRRITTRLREALALIDVRVLDHMVIGDRDCCSMAQRGLL